MFDRISLEMTLITILLTKIGPGHYDIKKPSVTGGNLVTKEERFKSVICDVPGPGTYQVFLRK